MNNGPNFFDQYKNQEPAEGLKRVTSDMYKPIGGVQREASHQAKKNTGNYGSQQRSSAASQQRNTAGTQQRSASGSQQRRAPSGQNQTGRASGSGQARSNASRARQSGQARPSSAQNNTGARAANTGAAANRNTAERSRQPQGRDTRRGAAGTATGRPLSPQEIKKAEKQKKALEKQKERDSKKAKRQNEKEGRKRLREDRKANGKVGEGHSTDEIAKARAEEKKKTLKIIAAVTCAVVVITAVILAGVFVYNNGAKIYNIEIEGESIYSKNEIIEAAGVYEGLPMPKLRKKDANEKVTSTLPYIHSVDFDWQYPDSLLITVTPTQELMLVKNGNKWFCVDEYDKILLTKKKKLTDSMYRVEGLKGQKVSLCETYVPSEENKTAYENAKKIVDAMRQEGTFKKCIINVSNPSDITAVYNSKIKLHFGNIASEMSVTQLVSRLKTAATAMAGEIPEGEKGYLLLEYEGRVVANKGTMDP